MASVESTTITKISASEHNALVTLTLVDEEPNKLYLKVFTGQASWIDGTTETLPLEAMVDLRNMLEDVLGETCNRYPHLAQRVRKIVEGRKEIS